MRISQLFLPLLLVAAVYFLFLRPQRARQRKAQELSSSIEPGQRVTTTAGMFATVVAFDDEGVLLEVAPGVQVKYLRAAIRGVVPAPDTEAGDEGDEGDPLTTGAADSDPDVYQPALDHSEAYRPATTAGDDVEDVDSGTKVRLAKDAPAASLAGATAAGASAYGPDEVPGAGSGDDSGHGSAGQGSTTSALR